MEIIKIKEDKEIPNKFTGIAEFPDGTKKWFKNRRPHREGDEPAIEFADGTRCWFLNGKLHRENKPAVEYSNESKRGDKNGMKVWYQNGKKHRLDGPAVIKPNGTKWWYKNGKLHRTDGPAVEYPNGNKRWYKKGKLHRLDGPAIEWAKSGERKYAVLGTKLSKRKYKIFQSMWSYPFSKKTNETMLAFVKFVIAIK